jgi:hypothetical protein
LLLGVSLLLLGARQSLLGVGNRLLSLLHHLLLAGQRLLEQLDSLAGGGLGQHVDALLQGEGGLGRPDVRQQLGLIVDGRAEAYAVAGIVNLQYLGQGRYHGLGLDPEFGRAALVTQWQGVVVVVGHAGTAPGRTAWPVPAPNFRQVPAEPQGGHNLLGVIRRGHGLHLLPSTSADRF